MIYKGAPRFTEFHPKDPVWCVTPDLPGCIHRFFDTSPISPAGRYLAVFQMPLQDRRAARGSAGARRAGVQPFIPNICSFRSR